MKKTYEKYLLIISIILLILISEFLFNLKFYIYSIVFFIGAFVIWLIENGKVHITIFWTLFLSGIFFLLIMGNFLFATCLIIIAFLELFLNSALRGYH
jgi:hypothetical protein